MVRVEVAEVGGLAVEIDDVGQVDRVSNHSRGVHEMVGYFEADQHYDLHQGWVTARGAT